MAGQIAAVGAAVTRFKPGDAVVAYAVHEGGAYAEYRCVQDGEMITHKPANVPYEVAVAVPFGGITAIDFLKAGGIRPGQRVLVYGASGSVGTYAVQLAHHFGADVTAVCGTANQQLVRSLGADRVLDYTRDDFTRGGHVYDMVFDTVGKTTFAQCKDVIKVNGCYLNAVMPFVGLKAPWYRLTARRRIVGGSPPKQPDVLNVLLGMVAAGTLRPVIERVYPWERIVEAHRHVDQGHKKGNVVIRVGQ
jgi:NADPH:quinone reductase-like Zn-dependent oxidoreductase